MNVLAAFPESSIPLFKSYSTEITGISNAIFTTPIHFYITQKNLQLCPAHRDPPTPSRLTLGSTFRIQHRPIPITASQLSTLNTPSGRSPPSAQPPPSNTAAYRHKSTKLPPSTTKHSSQKKPEGCAEGPRLCGPFAVFFFSKKILCPVRQKKRTTHSILKKVFLRSCYFT